METLLKRFAVLGLAAALVLLAACTEELGSIDLTPANNGEALDIAEHQILNIKLDSNATTGYQWNLVTPPDDRILKFLSSKYNAPTSAATGAGGSETWQFQAIGRGKTTFKLGYFRPPDPQHVAKEYSLTINVK